MKSLGSLLRSFDRGLKGMRLACALRTCHNTLLTLSVPQSRPGIKVGELWYCSVDCFATAASARLSELLEERNVDVPRDPRLTIGLVMLSKGFLTDDQLRLATTESQANGEDLETTLVRLGVANEKQLAAAKAAQWGYPVLGRERKGRPVEADIPPTLLHAFSAVPLHYSPATKRLLLGFVHRVEHSFLHSVEQVTGFRADACFITPTELEEQLERLTPVPGYQEAVLEELGSLDQLAKTVGSYSVEVAVKEATFALCKNYIWVRLSGSRGKVDLLFHLKSSEDSEVMENSEFLSAGRGQRVKE